MTTINVYNGKKDKTFRVQIRRTGHPPISESFKSFREVKQWAKIMETGLAMPNPLMRIKNQLENIEPQPSSQESSYTMKDLISRYRKDVMPFKAKTTQKTNEPSSIGSKN